MPVRRADDTRYILLENGSATGDAVPIHGGFYTVCASGTLTGTTASLQMQMPEGTWATVRHPAETEVSTTTVPAAHVGIPLPACLVRVSISGPASGVYCYLIGEG